MELQWNHNVNLSAFHAAWCITHFPDLSQSCAEPLRLAAIELDSLADSFSVERMRFWEQLLILAATVDFSDDLARRLMGRIGLSGDMQRSLLASALKDCRRHFEAIYPNYAREIKLRAAPLRQLWEAHGPGLLQLIRNRTETGLIVETAEVVLVQPIIAGMGYAHLITNRIHIEALLTNADGDLPETLRLAWLLSQLDFERPVYSELIHAYRLRPIAGLSVLPAVLQAGEELELCRCTPEMIQTAIQLWHIDTFQLGAPEAESVLSSWWETYQSARPDWRIALTGLDRMLQA